MSDVRQVHQIPIHILQELIIILRTNEKYIGEGKIGKNYYLYKTENRASIIFDNNKVSFIANFVKDEKGNWFFIDKISIRDSLKTYITENTIKEFSMFGENDQKEEGE